MRSLKQHRARLPGENRNVIPSKLSEIPEEAHLVGQYQDRLKKKKKKKDFCDTRQNVIILQPH